MNKQLRNCIHQKLNQSKITRNRGTVETEQGFTGKQNKAKMWEEMVSEVHEIKVSDPVVSDRASACSIYLDVTYNNPDWGRQTTTELAVLEITDGKIIREEYIY